MICEKSLFIFRESFMKIQDIMVEGVVSMKKDASITEVAETLSRKHFHALPVVDDFGTLLGIVTQYDLFVDDGDVLEYLPVYIQKLRHVGERSDVPEAIRKNIEKFSNMKVQDIMTSKCLTLSPDSLVQEAVVIFQKTNFGSIPIVDEQTRLVGIVTLRDVLMRIPENNTLFT